MSPNIVQSFLLSTIKPIALNVILLTRICFIIIIRHQWPIYCWCVVKQHINKGHLHQGGNFTRHLLGQVLCKIVFYAQFMWKFSWTILKIDLHVVTSLSCLIVCIQLWFSQTPMMWTWWHPSGLPRKVKIHSVIGHLSPSRVCSQKLWKSVQRPQKNGAHILVVFYMKQVNNHFYLNCICCDNLWILNFEYNITMTQTQLFWSRFIQILSCESVMGWNKLTRLPKTTPLTKTAWIGVWGSIAWFIG